MEFYWPILSFFRIREHEEAEAMRFSFEMTDEFLYNESSGFAIGHDDNWVPPIEPILPPLHPPPIVKEPSLLSYLTDMNIVRLMEVFDLDKIPVDIALRTIGDQHFWKRFSNKRFPVRN